MNNEFSSNTTAVQCVNSTSPPTIALQQAVDNNTNGFYFDNCDDPVIAAGNSFTNNASYGIRFEDCTGLGTLDSLIFTGNAGNGGLCIQNSGDYQLASTITKTGNERPLSIDVGSYPSASSTIPTTGNTNNDIQVTAGNSYTTGIWPDFADLDYIFTASPTIQNGGSLTISDGNTLKFNSGKWLYVSGTLNANGAARSGINFEYNGTDGTWSGIQYQYANSSGSLSYCTFRNSTYGLHGAAGVPMITVDHCNFYDNTRGSDMNNSGSVFTNCIFQNNTIGIYYNNCPNPNLGVNNEFSSNTTAVQCINSASPPTIALQQAVDNNTNGFYFDNCDDPVIVAGNSFTDNTEYGLRFEDCTGLGTLDSLIFTGNGGNGGLWIQNSGDFHLGSSITNSGNEWPLSIDVGSYPSASSTIPNTGNTNNDIQVTAGNSYTTGIWPDFADLDYIFTASPTIQNGGSLTISDGNTLKFNAGKWLYVSGTLNANGAARSGINFEYNGTDGTWSGIQYQFANSSGSLSYCTFRNSTNGLHGAAGVPMITVDHCNFYDNTHGSDMNNSGSYFTNCVFQNNTIGIKYNNCPNPNLGVNNEFSSNITAVQCINSASPPTIALQQPVDNNTYGFYFDHCDEPVIAAGNSFTNNASYGLRFEDCTGLGTLDSLIFTGNGGNGGLWIQNSGDFHLGSSITNSGNEWPLSIDVGSYPSASSTIPITGNTNNDIQVTAGNSYTTGIWPDFADLDYIFTASPTIQNGGSLTISDGNTLKFNSGKWLYVSGTLNANGAARSGINFEYNGTDGTWSGIQYQYANSSGSLSYCTFRNSTYGLHGAAGVPMIIVDHCNFYDNTRGSDMNNSGSVFTNCIFQNNTIGIYISNCSPTIHNCEIFENTQYGLRLNSVSIPNLGSTATEGNGIYSNGIYDIYNGSEDISALYTYWGPTGFFNIPDRIYDVNDDADL